MRNKIFAAILLAGAVLGFSDRSAQAQDFKTIESRGVYQVYSSSTASISTHSIAGYALSWSVKAVGGSANFEIKHSTWYGGNPNINLSSSTYLAAGETISDDVRGMVRNMVLHVTRLDSATTVYVDIPYLSPRAPGAF